MKTLPSLLHNVAWRFAGSVLATAVVAFGLSTLINFGLDHGVFGDSTWLTGMRLRYFIGQQVYEQAVGIFVHAFVTEVSFLVTLAAAAALVDEQILEDRGLAFVFISFSLYEALAYYWLSLEWMKLGWSRTDVLTTQMLWMFPLPGAINYGVRLLTFYAISRIRKFRAWTGLPWWSVFAPSVSYILTALILWPDTRT